MPSKTLVLDTQPLPLKFIFLSLMVFLGAVTTRAQDTTKPKTRADRSRSQIIDDTTRQIYGPKTSRYFTEQDIFFNRYNYRPIDTTIQNFHRYDYVQGNSNLYQDLGTMGTAIRPLYHQNPELIGERFGADVYNPYWDSQSVLYYDTKSPYTNMKVILGGLGRAITQAKYSRNINPNWNFGFTYRGMLIDKQIERERRGDRLVRDNYYDLYTAYKSKDSTYRLMANFRRSFHRVSEFGGVQLLSPDTLFKDYFDINSARWLRSAESNDLRIRLHLYHEYRIGKALQLYHTAEQSNQRGIFLENLRNETEGYFDSRFVTRDTVRDITKFKSLRNEVGVKGNLAKLFYNGYYALRKYSAWNNHVVDTVRAGFTFADSIPALERGGYESYIGGRMALFLNSIGEVSGALEYLLTNRYRVQGQIRSRWFEARITQMKYAPGYTEQTYVGAFDLWNNKFRDIESTQLNGYLHYRSRVLKISPGFTFTRLKNYVFYKKVSDVDTLQQVLPVQSLGSQVIASPEVRVALTFFKHITLSGQGIYTNLLQNDDGAFSLPELFVNGQLSYSNIFFNGNLDMHAGVDVHWKSAYNAMGYDPAIRQFYRQDEYTSPSFAVMDIFFNAKIKRGRVFFKYHNLLQALTKDGEGYIPTPGYPGQRNTFDFGFDWSFYD